MPIRLENVGIAVRDIDATIGFFTDVGLTVLDRDTVSGEGPTRPSARRRPRQDRVLQTPDGQGQVA